MRWRRRRRETFVKSSKLILEIAALVAVSWWGWRTLPEIVRYVRMERM
jgi:hypothetical protein